MSLLNGLRAGRIANWIRTKPCLPAIRSSGCLNQAPHDSVSSFMAEAPCHLEGAPAFLARYSTRGLPLFPFSAKAGNPVRVELQSSLI
jgi:hypothetical protein